MKQLFLFLSSLFVIHVNAQVSISNPPSNPDASAMLDVKSTNRGFLMPRVASRNDVPSPATGLMVYETASNAVWVRTTLAWVQLGSGGGSSQWITNGTHIYNGNTGNVGIGITLPTSKLHLVGNMLMDGTNPIIQLQNAGIDKGFLQLAGNNLRLGTNSGNNSGRVVLRVDNADRVIVDSTGNMRIDGSEDASLTKNGYLMLGSENATNIIFDNNEMMARNNGGTADLILQNDGGSVGIGTSPDERLDIAGSVKLKAGAPLIKMETAVGGTGSPFTSTKYAPGIQFIRQGTTTVLGKMEYVDTVNYTNFLRFYTGATASNDLTINTSHNVGIGYADPVAKLHIAGGGELLRLHSFSDPIMQITSGALLSPAKKGFIDVNGNDFRIGTNSENDAGNFIARVNGQDVMKITPAYNVGIGLGAGTPAAKLHVAGKIFANTSGEAIRIDGTNPAIGFFHNGGATSTSSSFISQGATELYVGVNGRLHLDATTSVAIGPVDTDGDGYKLAVNGRVVCEELKVKLSENWPDYVFKNSYKLLPLTDLKKFISDNNHLPNIPSAETVKKEGIQVGDMQKKLMEKVEELTLYILDLQKQIDELKAGTHNK